MYRRLNCCSYRPNDSENFATNCDSESNIVCRAQLLLQRFWLSIVSVVCRYVFYAFSWCVLFLDVCMRYVTVYVLYNVFSFFYVSIYILCMLILFFLSCCLPTVRNDNTPAAGVNNLMDVFNLLILLSGRGCGHSDSATNYSQRWQIVSFYETYFLYFVGCREVQSSR